MNSMKQYLYIPVCLSLYATFVVAQEPQLASPPRKTISGDVTSSETTVTGARIGRTVANKASQATSVENFMTPTPGRIAKFDNVGFLINSVIAEDASGRIGIGTTTPGSKLTVAGRIETLEGGIKFQDGTVQTTSAAGALFQVNHNSTLVGNGTTASPLGVNIPALGLLNAVAHNATLAGNGTRASPLGLAIPLSLSGSSSNSSLLEIVNVTGNSLLAVGGTTSDGFARTGINAIGGDGDSGPGGTGIIVSGGISLKRIRWRRH
jgi:hypothetical protein